TSAVPRKRAASTRQRASWPVFPATRIGCPDIVSVGGFEQAEALAAVNARLQGGPPGAIVQIPLHRLREAGLEVAARPPAQLLPRFRRVDGVALVMPRPVGHEGDQLAARPPGRQQAVEDRANMLDHREVGALALAAEVVAFARPAPLGEGDQGFGMVLDVEPV